MYDVCFVVLCNPDISYRSTANLRAINHDSTLQCQIEQHHIEIHYYQSSILLHCREIIPNFRSGRSAATVTVHFIRALHDPLDFDSVPLQFPNHLHHFHQRKPDSSAASRTKRPYSVWSSLYRLNNRDLPCSHRKNSNISSKPQIAVNGKSRSN